MYENLTDIEKVELAYKILNSIDDIVTRLWRIAWGLGHKNIMSAYEYDKTLMFIEKYGYDTVRIGFQEAASHNAYSLSYVEKVVTNKTTREAAEKEETEHRKRIKELSKIKEEVKPDLEKVKEAFKFPEPSKEKRPDNYEKVKAEFEKEINK